MRNKISLIVADGLSVLTEQAILTCSFQGNPVRG